MLLVVALAAWAGWTATGYGLWHGIEPGSGLFPLAAAVLAGGFAAATLAGSIAGVAPPQSPLDEAQPPSWRRLAAYAGVVLTWPLLLPQAGFLLSGALALLVLLRFGESLPWPRTLGFTALTLAASWLLFERLLGVGLPKGPFALALTMWSG
jgi:putative tricarboxylic transport membrane protein